MKTLRGKHAIVSGGGTGIGAEIAVALANAGANVSIVGRREEPLRATALRNNLISWYACDVCAGDAVKEAFIELRSRTGPVDIGIANAGSAKSVAFSKMAESDLRDTINVNLIGVFNVWKNALEDMKQAGWGRLLAVASTAGLKGYPYVSGYCAAKHGVIGLTRAVAQELAASNITANAICPGYVETAMLEQTLKNIAAKTGMSTEDAGALLMANNPQNRFVQPDEVAQAVLWLCGTGSKSVTGQAISISGGET